MSGATTFILRSALLGAALSLPAAAPEGMVEIPAGSFQMGRAHALPDDGRKWYPHLLQDDRPVHEVSLGAYRLDVRETTSREYAEFVAAGKADPPYYWRGKRPEAGREDDPVANVTWAEADAYCRWRGKRLPTEAEWERACRGEDDGRKYPWGEEGPDGRARFDSVEGPQAVCSFEQTGAGLCDMAGNVWEWTADFYALDYYSNAPGVDPQGPASGRYRVLRGGSWADASKYLTCAYRSYARPAERSPNIGFRCAAD